jgi:hypothetical protein
MWTRGDINRIGLNSHSWNMRKHDFQMLMMFLSATFRLCSGVEPKKVFLLQKLPSTFPWNC